MIGYLKYFISFYHFNLSEKTQYFSETQKMALSLSIFLTMPLATNINIKPTTDWYRPAADDMPKVPTLLIPL